MADVDSIVTDVWFHLDGTRCHCGVYDDGPLVGRCRNTGRAVTPCPPIGPEPTRGVFHPAYEIDSWIAIPDGGWPKVCTNCKDRPLIRPLDVLMGEAPGFVGRILVDVNPHPDGRVIQRPSDGVWRLLRPGGRIHRAPGVDGYRPHGPTFCAPTPAPREKAGPYERQTPRSDGVDSTR